MAGFEHGDPGQNPAAFLALDLEGAQRRQINGGQISPSRARALEREIGPAINVRLASQQQMPAVNLFVRGCAEMRRINQQASRSSMVRRFVGAPSARYVRSIDRPSAPVVAATDYPLPFGALGLRGNVCFAGVAIASFHLAQEVSFCVPLLVVFFIALSQLARQASTRITVYLGCVVGLCIYGPQLAFFWSIFHQGAIVLWLVLAAWLALYLVLQRIAWLRLGPLWGTLSAPVLWTALEYFRSELYFLRFSWLSAGYLLPSVSRWTGMYGAGFALMLVSALAVVAWTRPRWRFAAAVVAASAVCLAFLPRGGDDGESSLKVAGAQLEEASDATILRTLDELDAKYPGTPLFVLSEYSFASAIPPEIKAWCARHQRWLGRGR